MLLKSLSSNLVGACCIDDHTRLASDLHASYMCKRNRGCGSIFLVGLVRIAQISNKPVRLASKHYCTVSSLSPLLTSGLCACVAALIGQIHHVHRRSAHNPGRQLGLLSEHVSARTRIQAHLVGTWPTLSWNACNLLLVYAVLGVAGANGRCSLS